MYINEVDYKKLHQFFKEMTVKDYIKKLAIIIKQNPNFKSYSEETLCQLMVNAICDERQTRWVVVDSNLSATRARDVDGNVLINAIEINKVLIDIVVEKLSHYNPQNSLNDSTTVRSEEPNKKYIIIDMMRGNESPSLYLSFGTYHDIPEDLIQLSHSLKPSINYNCRASFKKKVEQNPAIIASFQTDIISASNLVQFKLPPGNAVNYSATNVLVFLLKSTLVIKKFVSGDRELNAIDKELEKRGINIELFMQKIYLNFNADTTLVFNLHDGDCKQFASPVQQSSNSISTSAKRPASVTTETLERRERYSMFASYHKGFTATVAENSSTSSLEKANTPLDARNTSLLLSIPFLLNSQPDKIEERDSLTFNM